MSIRPTLVANETNAWAWKVILVPKPRLPWHLIYPRLGA